MRRWKGSQSGSMELLDRPINLLRIISANRKQNTIFSRYWTNTSFIRKPSSQSLNHFSKIRDLLTNSITFLRIKIDKCYWVPIERDSARSIMKW